MLLLWWLACLVANAAAQDLFLSLDNSAQKSDKRPNFVYVLMDDMAKKLGDEAAVPQTRKLLKDGGASMENFFVSSPKCTPSRSAWLSGRYYHNIRPNGATSGRGLNTSNHFDRDALFPMLHKAGYQTGIFGKIHNNQASWLCKATNHTEPFTHIETECSPCGGYYRTGKNNWVVKEDDDSIPYLQTLDPKDPWSTYSEPQYGNRTINWIRKVAKAGRPFFAYVGTTGPHLGVIPAPWHRMATEYMNVSAPRTPNFNELASDHHPMLASAPVLDKTAIEFEDRIMRDRWGALMSIDDLVAGIVKTLEEEGVSDNTYVLFSSDHGYHLGQFRIPDEKMLPYETDIRVTFWIRGPGITPGLVVPELAANIDIAPTLVDLAGLSVPNIMDGKSMVPLIHPESAKALKWRTSFITEFAEGGWQKWYTNNVWKLKPPGNGSGIQPARMMPHTDITGHDNVHPCPGVDYNTPEKCQAQCEQDDDCDGWTFHYNSLKSKYPGWRCCEKRGFIADDVKPAPENTTSGVKDPSAYPTDQPGDMNVHPPRGPADGIGEYTYDTPDNQWRQLRVLNATHDFSFTEWDKAYVFDKIAFCEYYDISKDPWQRKNLCPGLTGAMRASLHAELEAFYQCRGDRSKASSCP